MKFVVVLSILALSLITQAHAKSKCPCFCFNKGPFFRRVNRARLACIGKPTCEVQRGCIRNGNRGAQCCNKLVPTPDVLPTDIPDPSTFPSPSASVNDSPSPTPPVQQSASPSLIPVCPCKCRRGMNGRLRGKADCRGLRPFCKVMKCRPRRRFVSFWCCHA